jgi:hypothetical protein
MHFSTGSYCSIARMIFAIADSKPLATARMMRYVYMVSQVYYYPYAMCACNSRRISTSIFQDLKVCGMNTYRKIGGRGLGREVIDDDITILGLAIRERTPCAGRPCCGEKAAPIRHRARRNSRIPRETRAWPKIPKWLRKRRQEPYQHL